MIVYMCVCVKVLIVGRQFRSPLRICLILASLGVTVTLMWGADGQRQLREKNCSSFRLWWLRECFCPSQTRRIKFKFESEAPPPAVMFWSVIFWMDFLLCGVVSRTEADCVLWVWMEARQVRADSRCCRSRDHCWSLNASRWKAVSRKRRSSIRWVFLFPVAGAAAGSLPAYLKHREGVVRGQRLHGGGQMVWSWWRWWWLPDGLGFLRGGPDARLHVVVVTLVLVLLLTPDQVGVGEALRLRLHLVEGERGELRGETACRYCLFTSHCHRVLFPVIP